MRVLIVEDEPLIAIDSKDIVQGEAAAHCVWSRTAWDGVRRVLEGVDFTLLDYDLLTGTSIPVAVLLADRRIPFCLVSALTLSTPARLRDVLHVLQPFLPHRIRKARKVA